MTKKITDEDDKLINMSIRYPRRLKLREQLMEMAEQERRTLNGQVQYLLLQALEFWKMQKKFSDKRRLVIDELKQDVVETIKKL